jgi:hypothetical protein
MSCGYTGPIEQSESDAHNVFSGWCLPCSGFNIDSSGEIRTFGVNYYPYPGNISGIFSWDAPHPASTTGIQKCRGYVESGTSFTDASGTFEVTSGGCPYVL